MMIILESDRFLSLEIFFFIIRLIVERPLKRYNIVIPEKKIRGRH